MALRETVELDIRGAQQQISLLESQLNQLSPTIEVPVEIEGRQAVALFEQQLAGVDAEIPVDADIGGAQAQLSNLDQSLGRSEQEAQRLASTMGQAGDEAQGLASDTGRVSEAAEDAADSTERLAVPWGRIALQIGAALGGLQAIRSVLASGFDRFTTIENATRTLTIQLQDAAAAGQLLDETLDVVTGTPFNLDQFANASAQLVAFGIEAEKIPGILTAVGEAAATRGDQAAEVVDRLVTVFGQVAANARISMAEVNRFADAGVNALAILGNSFGLTTAEMRDFIATGTVPAEEALDALATGIVEGTDGIAGSTVALGGTMEGLRETLTGAQGGLNAALARLGEAFISATSEQTLGFFQDTTDTVDTLTVAVQDLAPAIGLVADTFGLLLANVGPLAQGLGEVSAGIDSVLGLLPSDGGPSFLDQATDDLGVFQGTLPFLIQNLIDLRDLVTEGFTQTQLEQFLTDIAAVAEDAADPMVVFEEAVSQFSDQAEDVVPFLEELAQATGISELELIGFVQSLLLSANQLELTGEQVAALRALLGDLGGVSIDTGALIGFENLAGGASDLAGDLGLVAEAAPLSAEGIEFLNEAFGDVDFDALIADFPVVIRDIEDLQIAADDAGVSVAEFLDDIPDNVTLDLSQPQIEIATLIEELENLGSSLAEFQPEQVIDLSDFINEDTGQIDADLSEIRQTINEQLGEEAEFQLDLSQIAVVAPDIAAVLEAEGVDVAGDLAAKFAEDLENTADQQAFIDGNKGLALATAEQYADFLKSLTPEELKRVEAFGPQNLIPALREQLVDTGQAMAEILDTTLGETTIAPELTIDLANIIFQNLPELTFDVSATGTTSTGTTNPPPGTAPPPPPVEVNIFNPTTEDLNTSVTQSAQTISAVSSLLPRAQ